MGARMVPANGQTTKTKKIFYMSFWLERLSILLQIYTFACNFCSRKGGRASIGYRASIGTYTVVQFSFTLRVFSNWKVEAPFLVKQSANCSFVEHQVMFFICPLFTSSLMLVISKRSLFSATDFVDLIASYSDRLSTIHVIGIDNDFGWLVVSYAYNVAINIAESIASAIAKVSPANELLTN